MDIVGAQSGRAHIVIPRIVTVSIDRVIVCREGGGERSRKPERGGSLFSVLNGMVVDSDDVRRRGSVVGYEMMKQHRSMDRRLARKSETFWRKLAVVVVVL